MTPSERNTSGVLASVDVVVVVVVVLFATVSPVLLFFFESYDPPITSCFCPWRLAGKNIDKKYTED